MNSSADKKCRVLKEVFGLSSFRPGQDELTDAVLHGRDALGILPTGGGKSLCYQLPAVMLPGLAIVISPLIALMRDQVAHLRKNGIPAAYIASDMAAGDRRRVIDAALSGALKLLYVSPERLGCEELRMTAIRARVSFVAVDEAHCVSTWGRDFRPSYLTIRNFTDLITRAQSRRIPVAAFTASASPEVARDIEVLLGLSHPVRVVSSFDRPNLYLSLLHPADKKSALSDALLAHRGEAGIIYARTRRTAEAITRFLLHKGLDPIIYHAGMRPEKRKMNEERFLGEKAPLMVATCAFGMGIDRPDIRFVIHYNMPGDMESYYQEAGRAGRDGKPASCLLMADHRDVILGRFFAAHLADEAHGDHGSSAPGSVRKNPLFHLPCVFRRKNNTQFSGAKRRDDKLGALNMKRRDDKLRALNAMRRYASGRQCLRHAMLSFFGEDSPGRCGNCSVCRGAGAAGRSIPFGTLDRELLKDLFDLRMRLANDAGRLPYRICSDELLKDMASARPVSRISLLLMESANTLFVIRYGRHFLEEIRAYAESLPP